LNNLTKVQIPQNVIDFYKDLTAVQDSQKPLTDVDLSFVDLKKEFAEGNYAFRKGVLSFNVKDFRKTINDVIEVLVKHRTELKEDLEKQSEYFNKRTDNELKTLAEQFILEKDISQSLKEQALVTELSIIILLNSIKPYIRMMAEGLKDLEELNSWTESNCPICGWDPLLAKIEENGKRVLHCSLCDHDWQYKALKCVHCGTENHDKLQLITIPGVEGREIQVCTECQGYIKQVKTKEVITENNLATEDVKSLYLDLIAEKEGYKNKK